MAETLHQALKHKSLILCFDGTGNKFQGNQSDSNILKIFSLLDRQDDSQYHYYQPGIGTYVETSSLARKSRLGRIKSWYIKAKDQAIGTSFCEHVMAGYRFLMRYYSDGDKIYFFGFSRGAYTARFLAQMLDYVGLLSAGNEEMLRFAWKTFAKWQMRTEDTVDEKSKKEETFDFMKKFRETFSRPVTRIEFLGLFDCVNSVPQFESAWMNRTKFPYTARTSAKVIRHAVSIDERRAKFRQDLISGQSKAARSATHHEDLAHNGNETGNEKTLLRRPTFKKHDSQPLFRPRQHPRHLKVESLPVSSAASMVSVNSGTVAEVRRREDIDSDLDDETGQDILEVWFSGQHGDIGGGWTLSKDEERPLSDIALMWMLKEAHKAGLPFDEAKIEASQFFDKHTETSQRSAQTPFLQVEGQPVPQSPDVPHSSRTEPFDDVYKRIATKSRVHDSLAFGGGMGFTGVCAWQFMEYLPFRRMDLQSDGSWKPISWPLPRGETRDMGPECLVHNSVIRRMEADPSYRPGNLIVGGGGRGTRIAPEKYGTGRWTVSHEHGNSVSEVYIKDIREI